MSNAVRLRDIPDSDVTEIKQRVLQALASMDDAELRIAMRSEQSLAYYIAETFEATARLFGYIVAVPIAFVLNIARRISSGFRSGMNAAFEKYDW